MMNINWKVRIKNKTFWLAIIPAVILLIQEIAAVFGFALDLSDISSKLVDVVKTAFVVLAILGIVADPTTKGMADSQQAMTYETPKEDVMG